MTGPGLASLIILIVAAVLFLTRWVRLEIAALMVPVALYFSGAAPDAAAALEGFGNQAVLAIASVFVLGAGLQESGVAAWLARLVQRLGGKNEARMLTLMCLAVAFLSAFMSNAATVAVLLPVVIALARRAGLPARRLLMPVGFAAILGGNLTLIGTASNLLVSGYLEKTTGRGFGMFDFAWIGLPIVVAGVFYLITVGRRLLPGEALGKHGPGTALPQRLVREYGLASNIARVRVGQASTMRGRTVGECDIGRNYGLAILAVARRGSFGERWTTPGPGYCLLRGDDLYLEGPAEEVWRMAEDTHSRMGLPGSHHLETIVDHGIALAEAAVPPRSALIGKSVRDHGFRDRHGVNVLSLWRGGGPVVSDLANLELAAGDAMLLSGPAERVRELGTTEDLVLLTPPEDGHDFSKAPLALLCLAVALLPPLFGWAPLAISALSGALLMVLCGALPADRAARFIEWKVLALIVGTIPLGTALETHGVASLVAGGVVDGLSPVGVPAVLAVLFLLAALVSTTSSNAAAAVILSPVAAQAAMAMNINPRTALLAVAYGCSCAFLVPFAHQCNLMVAAPGGYKTRDYLVVGSGLTLVVCVVAILGLSFY